MSEFNRSAQKQMILEMQFSRVSERAVAMNERCCPVGEVSLVNRSDEKAAERLKKSARRDFEFVGKRDCRCDVSVVTWVPNQKFPTLRSEPLSHLPNQPSEPTPTSVTTPAAQEVAPAAVVAHL